LSAACKVLAQAEPVEHPQRVDGKYLACGLAGISANRIAIKPRTIWSSLSARKVITGPRAPFGCGGQPHLTGAALNLVAENDPNRTSMPLRVI